MRRQPSINKLISDISSGDKRVKIFGVVVSVNKEQGKLLVDDSTKTTPVLLNDLSLIGKLDQYQQGEQIMVIGWANPQGIDGEIIRKIEGFDPSRYKQVLEVWKNVRSKNE